MVGLGLATASVAAVASIILVTTPAADPGRAPITVEPMVSPTVTVSPTGEPSPSPSATGTDDDDHGGDDDHDDD